MWVKKSTGKVSDYLSERLKKEKPDTLEYAEITAVKKLLSNKTIKIYHGNKDKNMMPVYGCGGTDNDYGRGFYTTPDRELAKEWALRTGELGIQVFIKSEKAFKSLIKTSMEEVPVKYRNHFVGRDKRARDTYQALRLNQRSGTGKQTIYDFI